MYVAGWGPAAASCRLHPRGVGRRVTDSPGRLAGCWQAGGAGPPAAGAVPVRLQHRQTQCSTIAQAGLWYHPYARLNTSKRRMRWIGNCWGPQSSSRRTEPCCAIPFHPKLKPKGGTRSRPDAEKALEGTGAITVLNLTAHTSELTGGAIKRRVCTTHREGRAR